VLAPDIDPEKINDMLVPSVVVYWGNMRTNVASKGAVTEPEANTNARTPLRSAFEGAATVTLVNH
jgi:hypothetical protein